MPNQSRLQVITLILQDEMQTWLKELAELTGSPLAEAVTGKAHTMPVKSSKKEDSAKKKGKFTLKKK